MNLRKLALTASLGAVMLSSLAVTPATAASAREQFFPVLVTRTGPIAPNATPWGNGYIDYLKLVNARGGSTASRSSSRSAKLVTPPTVSSNATSV
jgi:branched-chain amino acid transport system substrate-binding protein